MFMLHLLKVRFRIIWGHLIVYLSFQICSLISRRTFFLGSIFTHILLIPITFLMQLFQTLSILEAFSPPPVSTTIRGPALPYLDFKDWGPPGVSLLPLQLSPDQRAAHGCSLPSSSFFPVLGCPSFAGGFPFPYICFLSFCQDFILSVMFILPPPFPAAFLLLINMLRNPSFSPESQHIFEPSHFLPSFPFQNS